MGPTDVQKRERRRLSKVRRYMEKNTNKGSRSKAAAESAANASRPAPTVSTPSGFSHNGLSKFEARPNLHFILFLTCSHNGFYSTGTFTFDAAFVSALRPVSPSSSSPVAVEEMYIFDRPCPGCSHRKARVLDELPESSFVKTLKRQPRWRVSLPIVETTIPESIRRFGKFDFEVEQGGEEKDRGASTTFPRPKGTLPVYIEEVDSTSVQCGKRHER
ncbi:MAG: hypothetical protein Q9195_007354 [Heterodermia aff. obscurata]